MFRVDLVWFWGYFVQIRQNLFFYFNYNENKIVYNICLTAMFVVIERKKTQNGLKALSNGSVEFDHLF